MTGGVRGKGIAWLWAVSFVVFCLGIVGLFTISGHRHRPPALAAPTPSVAPGETVAAPANPASQPSAVAVAAARPAPSRTAANKATISTGATHAAPSSGTSRAAPAPLTPACQSNTSLEQSPNSNYTYLCTVGGRPVAWPDGNIKLYDSGLSPIQQAGLTAALPQWESAGHFTVTQVASPAEANLTVTNEPISNAEAGYASTSYECTASRCWYTHALVQLSSTATLVQTLWVSTVLHELGHVAGLNHVSRKGEVMYPYVDDTSPVVYSQGDMDGLQAEYQARGGSSSAGGAAMSLGVVGTAAVVHR